MVGWHSTAVPCLLNTPCAKCQRKEKEEWQKTHKENLNSWTGCTDRVKKPSIQSKFSYEFPDLKDNKRRSGSESESVEAEQSEREHGKIHVTGTVWK